MPRKIAIIHNNKIPLMSESYNKIAVKFDGIWDTLNGPTPSLWYLNTTVTDILSSWIYSTGPTIGIPVFGNLYWKDGVGSYTTTVFNVNKGYNNGGLDSFMAFGHKSPTSSTVNDSFVYLSRSNSPSGLYKSVVFEFGDGNPPSGSLNATVSVAQMQYTENTSQPTYDIVSFQSTLSANSSTYSIFQNAIQSPSLLVGTFSSEPFSNPGMIPIFGSKKSFWFYPGATTSQNVTTTVETIIYFGTVSTTDKATINDYLRNKYNIY